MTEQAEVRRLQYTLSIAGTGVVAFCVWSIAKICLFLAFVNEEALRKLLGDADPSLIQMIYLSLPVIVVVDLALRSYVGLSARAEGRGKKKGALYLVVAAIVALLNALSLVSIALSTSLALDSASMIISIVVEATAVAALVLVVGSAIGLRRMSPTAG